MKNLLFVLGLTFFQLAGFSEALPEIKEETVDFLKSRLNSDRIEHFFGSYGVDALEINSHVFPLSRIANLHSVHQGKKIMRTLAIVDFFQPTPIYLSPVHQEIIEGKSIGIALREQGFTLHKNHVYFGTVSLSPELMDWMDEHFMDQASLHIYRLEVSRDDKSEPVPYCTILEVHSPQYLTEKWLQALYEDQYKKFSVKSKETELLLDRLSILIQDFPLQERH
ncbi:MAG: hypothetical protein H0V82_05330 [Candidatus Protochlamydia sp.]|nr:hypothetical protein [Candidatus Protochlamydia sp.]